MKPTVKICRVHAKVCLGNGVICWEIFKFFKLRILLIGNFFESALLFFVTGLDAL
jgi:hypothetical protein